MTDHSTGRPADPFTERTPRVVAASKLHRSVARRRRGRFLAEGRNSVEAALAVSAALEVFVTEAASERTPDLLAEAASAGVTVSTVTERASRALADTATPAGLFASCRSVVRGADRPVTGTPRLVAVAQALAEPGNVGTLIRVADALGADEVWCTEGTADPENPKAVRASAGSLFHLPVVVGVPETEVRERAHRLGMQLVVATGDGETDLELAEDLLARPTAWLFGNEAHGVPAALADAADARVRIPLRGRAESLNIVTAASICLHTSARLGTTAVPRPTSGG